MGKRMFITWFVFAIMFLCEFIFFMAYDVYKYNPAFDLNAAIIIYICLSAACVGFIVFLGRILIRYRRYGYHSIINLQEARTSLRFYVNKMSVHDFPRIESGDVNSFVEAIREADAHEVMLRVGNAKYFSRFVESLSMCGAAWYQHAMLECVEGDERNLAIEAAEACGFDAGKSIESNLAMGASCVLATG